MNVESVLSVIKRRCDWGNYGGNTKLQNKETKLKEVLYIICGANQYFKNGLQG